MRSPVKRIITAVLFVILLSACASAAADTVDPQKGEAKSPAGVTVIQNDDASYFSYSSHVQKFCDKGNLLYEYKQGDSTSLVVSQSDPQCTGKTPLVGIQVYP